MATTPNVSIASAPPDAPTPVRRPPAASRAGRRRVTRRALLVGATGAGVTAAGFAASRILGGSSGRRPPAPKGLAAGPAPAPANSVAPTAGTGAAVPSAPIMQVSPPVPRGVGGQAAATVPEGMALVTSPRLPLFGVGPEDPTRLLAGEIVDWRAVGSAVALPVEPLALVGEEAGTAAVATFPDYEALVDGLGERPGGVALVPLADVDFRVNVLSVGGRDPLREGDVGGEPTVRIGVVGDIVPGRNVHYKMAEYGDFTRPFHKVAGILSSFDVAIANLEGNLSDSLLQPADTHSFTFVSSPAMIEGFKLAGLDAVTLANNHSHWNSEGWGAQGLLDTMAALEAAEFPFFGAGRDLDEARRRWTTTVGDTTIAFLGIDGVTGNRDYPEQSKEMGVVGAEWAAGDGAPGTNPYASDLFLADIAAASEAADIVIPYFHLGEEYVGIPPEWVVAGMRSAIDAGATLVVTNHPHVAGAMEVYAGRPIVYSPGNFIFDQMFSVEVRSGFILDLTLRGDRVVGLRCHGVEIEDFHQPRLMTAGEQAALMDRFWANTDRLAARG